MLSTTPKRIAAGICLLAISAVAILLIPNLPIFDEELLPEIQQRLSNPVNPAIEGNAIYLFYGLSAASGKDATAVGKATIQTLRSKHANSKFALLDAQEQLALYGEDTQDKNWQTNYPAANCRPRERPDCFGELLAQLTKTSLSEPRLLEQLQRYEAIIESPHFVEYTDHMDYLSPVPSYGIAMQLDKLRQANAYQTSGLDGLISSSQTNMAFWRMSLRESQTTIGKMVTIATLRWNLQSLSYAIAKAPALNQRQTESLQTLLQPLTQDEINIEEVFTAELRFGAENWRSAPKGVREGESLWMWLLFQPNASANWFYRQTLTPAFAATQLSPRQFYERARTPVPALEFSHFNPYNLGGKIDMAKNWQLSAYQGRAHDLAGMYKLVALQLELKTIPTQDWPTAIANSPHKNPYTEKAFDYDATHQTLGFKCVEAIDMCRINL